MFAHAFGLRDTASTRLSARWLTIWSKASTCSPSASWTPPAPFTAAAAASMVSVANRSLICAVSEFSAAMDWPPWTRSAPGRWRPRPRWRRRGDGWNHRTGLDRASLAVDHGAQLALASVELLAPSRSGSVEDAAALRRVSEDALSRSLDPASRSSSACPRTMTVSCSVPRCRRGARRDFAVDDDRVVEPRVAALSRRSANWTGTEVAGNRVAGFAEPVGDGLALDTDRADGLRRRSSRPADEIVRIPSTEARAARGLGDPRGERVAMEADRPDGLRATCGDAGDEFVRVLRGGAARRLGIPSEAIGDRVAVEADRPRPPRRSRRRAPRSRPRAPRRRCARADASASWAATDRRGSGSPRQPGRRLR